MGNPWGSVGGFARRAGSTVGVSQIATPSGVSEWPQDRPHRRQLTAGGPFAANPALRPAKGRLRASAGHARASAALLDANRDEPELAGPGVLKTPRHFSDRRDSYLNYTSAGRYTPYPPTPGGPGAPASPACGRCEAWRRRAATGGVRLPSVLWPACVWLAGATRPSSPGSWTRGRGAGRQRTPEGFPDLPLDFPVTRKYTPLWHEEEADQNGSASKEEV